MANAKECDRCGNFYKNEDRTFDNYYSITKNTPLIYGTIVDLCPDCEIKLSEWVNEFKRKEETEAQKELKGSMQGCGNGTI